MAQLDIRVSNNHPFVGKSFFSRNHEFYSFSELTHQFGYFKFDTNELSSITRLSQYIRLALNTNAKTVVEFIQRAWRLPNPDLIISVTGGGKQCNMSPHLRKAFQRGLVAAAATTSKTEIDIGETMSTVVHVNRCLVNHSWCQCGCD